MEKLTYNVFSSLWLIAWEFSEYLRTVQSLYFHVFPRIIIIVIVLFDFISKGFMYNLLLQSGLYPYLIWIILYYYPVLFIMLYKYTLYK